jgi:hypothetical protein
MAWMSCSLRGIGFAPNECLFSILGDRISEISSSDRASFPAGFLGQRLGQFCCRVDHFDHPISWKKSRAIAFSLAMVAITFANASKIANRSFF